MTRAGVGEDVRGDEGFALVSVIWLATLLAVVAFVFTSAVRSHVREAEAQIAVAEADALAEAAVNLAILRAFDPSQSETSGTSAGLANAAYACPLGGGFAQIRIGDETGKIDLNIATDELLQALFTGLGLSREDAAARVEAIADYRDADNNRRLNGAEREEYAAAGRPSGPKNAPFEAVEELAGVIGFDAETVHRLNPFLTVHSRKSGIDPALAPPGLVALLTQGAQAHAAGAPSPGTTGLPPRFMAASTRTMFTVTADVQTARGARFVREAVVQRIDAPPARSSRQLGEVRAPAPLPFRIWRWRRGEAMGEAQAPDAPTLPAC